MVLVVVSLLVVESGVPAGPGLASNWHRRGKFSVRISWCVVLRPWRAFGEERAGVGQGRKGDEEEYELHSEGGDDLSWRRTSWKLMLREGIDSLLKGG